MREYHLIKLLILFVAITLFCRSLSCAQDADSPMQCFETLYAPSDTHFVPSSATVRWIRYREMVF